MSPVARTREAGWELGVRRTTAASLDRTWVHLLGAGLASWLGDATLDLARGAPYTTADGTAVSFLQKRMRGPEERGRRLGYWDRDRGAAGPRPRREAGQEG
jgi:hypothetical protein